MNHEHYQQRISEFIDREIRAEDEEELFSHLNSCGGCREFLKASCRLRVDIALTKAKESYPPARTPGSNIADRVPAHQIHQSSRSRSPISTFVLLAVVTLIVAMLFSANVKVERSAESESQELTQPR
jgi:hypothetical protein